MPGHDEDDVATAVAGARLDYDTALRAAHLVQAGRLEVTSAKDDDKDERAAKASYSAR